MHTLVSSQVTPTVSLGYPSHVLGIARMWELPLDFERFERTYFAVIRLAELTVRLHELVELNSNAPEDKNTFTDPNLTAA